MGWLGGAWRRLARFGRTGAAGSGWGWFGQAGMAMTSVAQNHPQAQNEKPPGVGALGRLELNQAGGLGMRMGDVLSSFCIARRPKQEGCALTIHQIQLAVAARFGMSVRDLATNRAGGRSDARPRMLVCWLARQCTPYSLPRIGRCFGGRDHKTVANAIRRIEDMMLRDAGLRRIATEIRGGLA